MNHGPTIITLKQSSSIHNGRHGTLRDRKKHAKFTTKSSQPGQTVNRNLYREVLIQLRESEEKTAWDVKNGDWLLHHDNVPAHISLVVREFLIKKKTWPLFPTLLIHFATCNFYVFPKMKFPLKGRRFISTEKIKAESQQVLNTLMPADLNECFLKWQNRWDRCIQSLGDYFEVDGGN